MGISPMAASGLMNLATGSEIAVSTLYLAVPSPQALPPVVTSILEREVLAIDDLVPLAEDVQARVLPARAPAILVQAPVVPVRVPAVDAIDCWLRTWETTSQKSPRSTPSQPLHQLRPYPLTFRLSNSNNDGSLPRRRRGGCTRVPWLELNKYKVFSRFLPPSRARRFTRYVQSCSL